MSQAAGHLTRQTPHEPASDTGDTGEGILTEVLVVEDNQVERVRLEAILRKFGYRVHCASDGSRAVEMLEKHSISLVVTDWRMPGMTGIELCRVLRGDDRFEQPYVILVTGQNTKSDLVTGMDAGADDFISKPFRSEEFRVRLQAGVRVLRLRNEVKNRNRELEQAMQREMDAHAHIQRDLDAAARAQRELLPGNASPFPQLQIETLFMPAVTVTGDTFNYFRLDDRHLAFYQIDVAGHGITSAMLSFTLSRILSPGMGAIRLSDEARSATTDGPLASHIVPPSQVVDSLNKRFVEKHDCQSYFTMVYGVLEVLSGEGLLCQAGHPHPLLTDPQGRLSSLGSGGFPVGMLEQAEYEDIPFRLEPGSRLFVYSDGITDVTNDAGEQFGGARLGQVLKRGWQRSLDTEVEVVETLVKRWTGNAPIDDDISLLAISRAK